uniref:TPR repeat protein (Modular protein) n=1 Tax=mine drainage metagenome TaxID=410659 RepID=E6QK15_9ZZZZ
MDQASLSDEEICQRRVVELLDRAIALLDAGDARAAAEIFRCVIKIDDRNIEAHHGLARALRDAGQHEAAIAAALALTVLTPADPLAHTGLSIALQQAGHIPQAEAAAARARILEWKQQLAESPVNDPGGEQNGLC